MRVLLAGSNGQAAEVAELLRDPDVEILGRAESADETREMLDTLQPDLLVVDAAFTEAMGRVPASTPTVFLPRRRGRDDDGAEDGSGQLELLRTCVALGSAVPLSSEIEATET